MWTTGQIRSVMVMTNATTTSDQSPPSRGGRLGLPLIALFGLALLALPRIVLHDLDLISGGSLVNAVLVFLPPLVWIVVVLWRRVPNPFVTLLVVGVFHGAVLALTHQLLWNASFADERPALGGNLADLDADVQNVIIRFFAVVSSLFTGVVVAAIAGLVAWGCGTLGRLAKRS